MAREGAQEDPAVSPDVEGSQKRLTCPQNAPDVIGEGPDPNVGDLKTPKVAQNTSEAPGMAAETTNPDVLWAKNGHRTLQVDSDTDVEEEEGPNPDAEPQKQLKMTQNVPETPDVGLKPPNPDVLWLKNGHGTLQVESDTDVEEEPDPEVEPPKGLKITPNVPETPDVAGKTPNPDVSGPKICCGVQVVDSDTDVEEDPDVQPPKRLKVIENMPGIPDVEVETPSPAVGTPKTGHWTMLLDSDTDVEGENPDVQPPKQLRMTQNVPEMPGVAATAPNPDVSHTKLHSWMLLVDSDTDVEDDVSPDMQPPKRLKLTQTMPRIPDVEVATPNPAVERPKIGHQTLVEDSDTDMEEDPDVQPPKRLRRAQNVPKAPDVRRGTRNPDVSGPTVRCQMLLVDSDTDVEEDPDVQPLKRLRATQNVPETPDVSAKPPNPDVAGPEIRCPVFLVDSDTDVEEGEVNPDVETLKKLAMTPNVPESPDVMAQTPDADVGVARNGCQALLADSDPDVSPAKRWEIPQNVPQTPDAPTQPPNPGVKGSQRGHGALLDHSDTDVEEEENPDVGSLKRPKPNPNIPETPDVRLKMPHPDVSGTKIGCGMLLVDSETDVEEDEADPDVRPLQRQKMTQNVTETPHVPTLTPNPAVGGSESRCGALVVESDPDVEEDETGPDVRPSKRQKMTQNVPKTPDVWRLQRTPNVAETPDVEEEEEGWDPDVATQLFLPPNPDVGVAETDPGVGSPERLKMSQKPSEIPDVEEEEESDPNLATQLFLPSPDVGSPESSKTAPKHPRITDVEEKEESDPDVATQLFLPSPDVESPKLLQMTQNRPKIPGVEGETPDQDEEEEQESDADVATQLFLPSPDVGSPEGPKTTPKGPKIPDVEGLPSLDPDVATQLFLPPHPDVDGPNPDVLGPKQTEMASNDPKIPVVRAETPDPDVEGEEDLDVATQLFLPPDPDVGGEGPSDPGVGSPKAPKSPLNPPEIPDVDMENPSPDVEGPPRGHRTLLGGADPDVEEAGPNPDVAASTRPQTAPKVPEIPDAEVDTPNPDVEGPPSPAQEEAEAPPIPQVRRSRRLAESGGGGASRDPTPAQNGLDQTSRPRPSAKPCPQRGQGQSVAVLEEATPSVSIKGNGRGSHAAPPPEEEEPAEGAKRRLRPRAAPGSAQIRVLFTGLVASPALQVALGTLGGTEATSVHDCSHLVTDGIRRTLKFLCALGRGVPIVTPQWLLESSHSGRPLSPGPFLPRDLPCERRFGFRLRPALARARERPLLQGYQVHVTPSVQPCPEDMRDIVTCCGGTFLPQLPREHAPRVLVISCPQDRWLWPPAVAARLPLLSAELLLSGVLRQRLELAPFLLSPWQPPESTPEPEAPRNQKHPTQNQKNPTGKTPNPTQTQKNPTGKTPDPTQNQKNPTPNPTQNSPEPTQNQKNPTQNPPNSAQKRKNPPRKAPDPTPKTPDPAQKSKNPPEKAPNPARSTANPPQKTPNPPQNQKNPTPKTPNPTQQSKNPPQNTPPQTHSRPHLGGSTPPPSPPRTRSGRRPPQNPPPKTPNSGTHQKTPNPPKKTPNPPQKTPKRPPGSLRGSQPRFWGPRAPTGAPQDPEPSGTPPKLPSGPPKFRDIQKTLKSSPQNPKPAPKNPKTAPGSLRGSQPQFWGPKSPPGPPPGAPPDPERAQTPPKCREPPKTPKPAPKSPKPHPKTAPGSPPKFWGPRAPPEPPPDPEPPGGRQ
ncbi:mediator of DNA damage checkpoint protein 1 isoform X2 [Passer domesticus]|uniref:mediator of DNA damage checkpoint protein 1 isoform X2 n=1 Tax=Passer domesticus TaxID=48849 RepID=UPI0030FE85F3